MALTRDYKESIRKRSERDPEFAACLMKEALTAFVSGEPETARAILRELVNSTIGFELLSAEIEKPSKSVHRMLSPRGNPTMDNLTSILVALQKELATEVQVVLAPHNIAPKADGAKRRRLA